MDDLAVGLHGGDLLADLLDVAVDGAVGDDALVAVHRVDELVAGVDAAGVGGEDLEELVFDGGELEVLAGDARLEAGVVQPQAALGRGSAAPGAAQDGLDAGDDLARAERLADVVVGAELEAEQAVDLV